MERITEIIKAMTHYDLKEEGRKGNDRSGKMRCSCDSFLYAVIISALVRSIELIHWGVCAHVCVFDCVWTQIQ